MRSASPLDQVVDLLSATGGKPRRSGSQWMARCPAHSDRRPSLSLRTTDDGVVLLHCFAGCATGDVLSALGLAFSDLYPASSRRMPDWVTERRSRVQRRGWSRV